MFYQLNPRYLMPPTNDSGWQEVVNTYVFSGHQEAKPQLLWCFFHSFLACCVVVSVYSASDSSQSDSRRPLLDGKSLTLTME